MDDDLKKIKSTDLGPLYRFFHTNIRESRESLLSSMMIRKVWNTPVSRNAFSEYVQHSDELCELIGHDSFAGLKAWITPEYVRESGGFHSVKLDWLREIRGKNPITWIGRVTPFGRTFIHKHGVRSDHIRIDELWHFTSWDLVIPENRNLAKRLEDQLQCPVHIVPNSGDYKWYWEYLVPDKHRWWRDRE